jgi:hypothetical protein
MCKNHVIDEKFLYSFSIDDSGVTLEILWDILDEDYQDFLVHSFAESYQHKHDTCQNFLIQLKKGFTRPSILDLKNKSKPYLVNQ